MSRLKFGYLFSSVYHDLSGDVFLERTLKLNNCKSIQEKFIILANSADPLTLNFPGI